MKYHDFLKLPFPDTVLAKFLQVSLPTIAKLRHDQPIRQSTIRNIGRRLQLADTEIIAALETLSISDRTPAFRLNPELLQGQLNRKPFIDDAATHFAVSSVLIGPHHLLVGIIQATPTLRKRLDHSLYADDWQAYPTCPLNELSVESLHLLMRTIYHKTSPVVVVADTNYHHHSMLPYQFAILLALKTHTHDEQVDFELSHEAIYPTFASSDLLHQQQDLNTFIQLAYPTTIHLRTVPLAHSLDLQAVHLATLAAQKLPPDQLSGNHIRLQTVTQLAKNPYFAHFLQFQKHTT